ncbi:hypothetical protein PENFLA_c048G01390 [Penicillium flavigenum]|uniref:WSC domain-containing protein n=1 Tax=Penicillium flavigenum TaxID=254877 RepID=A0A1V6SHN5_9EURO|nr:hypothetical protein PENFLA_c048G01390 [Penicillium flavigenum]
MLFHTQRALVVSSVLMAATSAVAKDFKVLPRGAPLGTLQGCYSSIPGYGKSTSWTYQSSGWCLDHCAKDSDYAAFALTGGSDCVCGNTLPPASSKVSNDKCGKSCSGWPDDMCGGPGFYSVYTTGLEDDVPTYSDSESTTTKSSSDSKTTTKTDGSVSTTSSTSGETTETVTPEASAKASDEDVKADAAKSKNTAAIAAGVVVGVVGFAALCGAAFFWWRSKKNKAGAAGGATGGYGRTSGPPSMSDSRFDGDYMAQRRQSNGSIDDDHDFSRRILQVTNPDR